jgi:hypothetical protein
LKLEWIEAVKPEVLIMTQHKFKVQLLGRAGSNVAALKPPFDVVAVFHRKGRVPVEGTINGFPFRSSLMNMGDGHMMVINAQLRTGAQCKAGDTVSVLMALDEDERTAMYPDISRGSLPATSRLGSSGPSSLSSTRKKIGDAKRPETREKRIAAMMDALRKNQRKK